MLTPLYDKNVSCPFCTHTFKTKKVRSRFAKPIKTDEDFCQHYEKDEHNPIIYFINVCPECGFSFSDNTSPYFPPGTKESIQAQVASKWNKQNASYCDVRTKETAIQTYKLALFSATLKKEKHVVLAGICLRLAWLYRMLENTEQEDRFNRLALAEYMSSYYEGDYENLHMSEMSLLYLIGEINRRLKNYHEAIRFFSRVTNHPNRDSDPKYIKFAREQWEATRSLYEQEKQEKMIIEEENMIDNME